MATRLVWRRCGVCGQLTLVPVSANACWQCGASLPEASIDADPNTGRGSVDAQPGQFPAPIAWTPFSIAENLGHPPAEPNPLDSTPVERNLPPAKPRFMDLSPNDDAVATQLLESVFPDGLTL